MISIFFVQLHQIKTQESDLQWESQKENLLDGSEDDDRKSISSESSGDGGGIPLNLPNLPKTNDVGDDTLWQHNDEIENIIKELPNSNDLLETVTSGDLNCM